MAKDVVCGMTVNEKNVKFKSNYKGTVYYFCSEQCKKSFENNPERYKT